MKRKHRRIWQSARTLADLGELTAQWLEGTLPEHPGYLRIGPDDETLPIADTLAAINRAGAVTISSQPGEIADDDVDWHREQRAAVEALIGDPDVVAAYVNPAEHTGIWCFVYQADRRRFRWRRRPAEERGEIVTTVNYSPATGFGHRLSERFLCGECSPFNGCHGDVLDAVCDAWQVTLIDPEWGRNDLLWPLLDEVAAALTGPAVGGGW